MNNDKEPDEDYAPFPIPFPESTGFSPLDNDNRKEWRKDKPKWEEVHGKPEESASERVDATDA